MVATAPRRRRSPVLSTIDHDRKMDHQREGPKRKRVEAEPVGVCGMCGRSVSEIYSGGLCQDCEYLMDCKSQLTP